MTRSRAAAMAITGGAVAVLIGSAIFQTRAPGVSTPPLPGDGEAERIRVEIFNAAGIPGVARQATDRLRDGGFDVVYFGNTRSFSPDTSLVIDRVGRIDLAEGVARAMEIGRVLSRPDSTLYLDVTVVLGRDWVGVVSEPVEAADTAQK